MTLELTADLPASPAAPALLDHSAGPAMPPLDLSGRQLSRYEFWPMWAFYAPAFAYVPWLALRHRGLTLPALANPGLPGGGLYGESKSAILEKVTQAAPARVAPFIAHDRPAEPTDLLAEVEGVQARLAAAGLSFPLVAKPDLGCRGAGVRPVRDAGELAAYLRAFPAGARLVLQRMVPAEGEAGVFYVRPPGESRGKVVSLTLKYFPRVTGDGVSTLRQLILGDPRAGLVPHLYLARHADRLDQVVPAGERVRLAFSGSHSKGAIFRDGTGHVTPALEAAMDAIADGIPGFHFGRFDVRFDDFQAFRRGEGFTILELNGGGAEMTHVWDRSTPLLSAWKAVLGQYRTLFRFGAAHRAAGHKAPSIRELWAMARRERELTPLYPPIA